MTYKDALGLVKEASKLNWSLKAIKAASNRLRKLRTPIEDPSQYLWFMHSAMKDMPRYRKLPSVTLKNMKLPYEKSQKIPAFLNMAKRLNIDPSMSSFRYPANLSRRYDQLFSANAARQGKLGEYFQKLRQQYPHGYYINDIPNFRIKPGDNNASAQLARNLITLGNKSHQSLGTLAHQMGHLFDSARGYNENIPSAIRSLRKELHASATGLRALKNMGFSDAQIARARQELKTAYKTYRYGDIYELQKAKENMFRQAARLERQLASPVPEAGIRNYPWLQKKKQILEELRRKGDLEKEWKTLFDRIFDREDWIRRATWSRRGAEKSYQRALKKYKKELQRRGLPEEPWLDW